MDKPFSQACENNKAAILEVISQYFNNRDLIFEVGSGTGQHAMYFAEKLPQLYWQTSDMKENLRGINLWINEFQHYNLGRPYELDVNQENWPLKPVSGVFSANTAHIMNWPSVENLFRGVSNILSPEKYFCLYGPFNIDNQYTSESNRSFDMHLKAANPSMGLRNLEQLQDLAEQNNLQYVTKHPMPANNFILVWKRNNQENNP